MARRMKSAPRMTARSLALVLVFAAAAFTPRALAQRSEVVDERPGVFIVGDSHVRMLGPMLRDQLEDGGLRVLGYESRPGWSTARYQRAADLREVLLANGRPEIVVVSLGGNDFVRSREAYREQLAWIVAEARSAGAREVIWVGPATSDATVSERAARTGARHEHNAELQRELLPGLGVRWVDSRPMTESRHGADGVHFTREGYVGWAGAVRPEVEHVVGRMAPGAEPVA